MKNETRHGRQKQAGYQALLLIDGLKEELADRLYEAGITSLEEFVEVSVTELEDLTRLSEATVVEMQARAKTLLETEAAEKAQAEEAKDQPEESREETSNKTEALDQISLEQLQGE